MMQQWRELKAQHPNALLLYRCGDFYEMFYEDAEVGSRVLGLTLTSRNNGGAAEVPLAGVPVKAVNEYLRRLVQQGFRVAVCEQTEDPRLAKGIVRREVVETITPGAAFADDLLESAHNNFLCAVSRLAPHSPVDTPVGIAAADLSTGEFRLFTVAPEDARAVLARLAPREVLTPRAPGSASGASLPLNESAGGGEGALQTERESWEFEPALAREELARHFDVSTLDGFGLAGEGDDDPAIGAAGALLRYLHELQPAGVPHLMRPVLERMGGVMPLDDMTRRNLELVESLRGGETAGTLLDVLDRTQTPMGARLLRQWVLAPLVSRAGIEARLEAVQALADASIPRAALREALAGVRDIERLASKAAAGRATPRELGALGHSLARLPHVENAVRETRVSGALEPLARAWDGCADVTSEIVRTLVDRPPTVVGDEATVRPGVDSVLDELRALRDGGKDAIARIQAEERARTGISSLKVGYNKVFGYYIEVTNANRELVPAEYQRRQTLTGAERFVTPALKEYEERVLSATERIETRERELCESLRRAIGGQIARLQHAARALAELDVLATLAEVAEREGYARPEVHDGFELEIVRGRHPVVERMMPRERFIPNDISLKDDARLIILTGPNMAGKSTILRQVGLIVVMAQMGSFVPAERARIGLVDRLFTRVGASDNLVRGQSTFMVEMSETSAILHNATRRSLVLLDEIGRGTSTYDGVAIAWAVSEHLHDRVGCKTMFATHYHELMQLPERLQHARNYNVAVREAGDRVVFLHRLEPGGTDRSYGVHVALLAGLPPRVVTRAREILNTLEGEHRMVPGQAPLPGDPGQLALFGETQQPDPMVEELKSLDVNTLTPLEALNRLADFKRRAGERK